jgi:hypothetical protein
MPWWPSRRNDALRPTRTCSPRLAGEHYAIVGVFAAEEVVRARPFDAIELDLAILWADVLLPAPEPG